MMALKELLSRPQSLWFHIGAGVVAVWLLMTVGGFLVDSVPPDNSDSGVFGAHPASSAVQPTRLAFLWQIPIAVGGMMRLKELFSRPRSLWLRIPVWIVAVWLLLIAGRFVVDLVRPYSPKPLDEVAFLDHAETKTIGPVRVTASALSPVESAEVFGAPLALDGIQPIWLEVENGDTMPLFYLRAGTDPEWFSPYETYWLNRLKAPRGANRRMEDRFYRLHFQNPVLRGQTSSGFIFTRLDRCSCDARRSTWAGCPRATYRS